MYKSWHNQLPVGSLLDFPTAQKLWASSKAGGGQIYMSIQSDHVAVSSIKAEKFGTGPKILAKLRVD